MKIEPFCTEVVIVRVGKTLDFRSADAFKTACQEQVAAGKRKFILDFSETGILDSTGLGAIFSLYRQLMSTSGRIVFALVSRPVASVIQLTRISKVFQQFPSVEAALEALGCAEEVLQ